MAESDDARAIPSAARIDALIDDMERCALLFRKATDPDERAEAYVCWYRALHEIAELRRNRAKKMGAAAGTALSERVS